VRVCDRAASQFNPEPEGSMSIEALIFDVDGTLADTEEAHREAFNAAFLDHGLDWFWTRSRYAELLGVSGGRERMLLDLESRSGSAEQKEAIRVCIPQIHCTKVQHYKAMVESGRVPLRDGVERLIREARSAGLKLGIATTGTASGVEALIRRTLGNDALSWFGAVVAGDQVGNRKPAPDSYHRVLRALNADPAACVAFEDSENGVKAARAAGLFVVATPSFWTLAQDYSQADLLLPTLGDPQRPIPVGIAARRTQRVRVLTLACLERLHRARDAESALAA
jgi:HAD superfamily hydrolase (TIGR01509 family)